MRAARPDRCGELARKKKRLTARGIETLMLPYGRAFQGSAFEKPELHVEKARLPGQYHLNAPATMSWSRVRCRR